MVGGGGGVLGSSALLQAILTRQEFVLQLGRVVNVGSSERGRGSKAGLGERNEGLERHGFASHISNFGRYNKVM